MASFGSAAWSSIGKKVITGLTGFLIIGFIIVHLIGNLTLLIGPGAFNQYAHFLENLMHGWLIYAFEVGLVVIFLFHIVAAVAVAWTDKRAARRQKYRYARDAKGKSRKTLASRSMIVTGLVLLVYIVLHIKLFKFGDHEFYATDTHGQVKNLYKTVVTIFQGPIFTGFTVLAMVLLGLHLRHGFWSAFQSLGWTNDRYLPVLTRTALVFALAMAVGFIVIPVYLFLAGDPNAMPGGH